MIKGYGQENIALQSFEIALVDRENNKGYTISIHCHNYKANEILDTTKIPFEQKDILLALGNALIGLEILKEDSTSAELKATKFHLEDMRKIIFMEMERATV